MDLCPSTPDIIEVKPTHVKSTSVLREESDILVTSDSSSLVGSAGSALEVFALEGFCTPQKTLKSVSVTFHVKPTSPLRSESDVLVGSDSYILVSSAASALEGFASEGFCTPQKPLMLVSVSITVFFVEGCLKKNEIVEVGY